MNKKQWYACGFVFSIGVVLCYVSTVMFRAMPMDDVTFAAWFGGNLLLGKACILGAVACFLCGWLEKEDAR